MAARPIPNGFAFLALLAALPASGAPLEPAVVLEDSNAGFGNNLATVGDTDGDGLSDLVVGGSGLAQAYLGAVGGVETTATTVWTGLEEDAFGLVAAAGDVDGDGYQDVLVSALGADGFRGSVNLYRGSAAGPESASAVTIRGVAEYNLLGGSLGGGGDLDGDGYDDVVLGTPYYGSGDDVGGAVQVHGGTPDGLVDTPDVLLVAPAGTDRFGAEVEGATDLDADGYDELVVLSGDSETRDLMIWRGGPAFSGGRWDLAFSMPRYLDGATDHSAWHATGAGDVDGDGVEDLLSSAFYSNNLDHGGDFEGGVYAYVIAGSPDGLGTTPASTLHAFQPDGQSSSLAGAGDVNADGFDDLVFGCEGWESWAFVLYGSPGGVDDETWTALPGSGRFYGSDVAGDDLDGDGASDVVVGAPTSTTIARSAVYVYLGPDLPAPEGAADPDTGETGDTGASDTGAGAQLAPPRPTAGCTGCGAAGPGRVGWAIAGVVGVLGARRRRGQA